MGGDEVGEGAENVRSLSVTREFISPHRLLQPGFASEYGGHVYADGCRRS